MGKKGRKTRWRRLPIGGPESTAVSSATTSPPAEEQDRPITLLPENRLTFNEDEYTKITTPRQDVLFKKGYLGRRRVNNPSPSPDAGTELNSTDSVESECIPEEPVQFSYIPPTPAGFIDHSGVLYVNGSTYELYDPYSGNMTIVVGPAPQFPPQPVLAAMPCQPVPLNSLEWFNPSAPWMCTASYNNRRKRYSTDSQNCSAQSSDSTGPPGSPQEQPMDEVVGTSAGAMYPPQVPPPYMYPGYMFGAPVYNYNGVNLQGVAPQQQPQSIVDPANTTLQMTATKRRKKRRRRRRGGVTDEGSESSCEDVIGCDAGVCSQSGASSDAGQGSSCSKTNSDSGINTEPTPDSGSNTPPLIQQLSTTVATQCFKGSKTDEDNPDCPLQQKQQQQEFEDVLDAESEPVSSSVSTPEAHKCTFESLPSEDGDTLQEMSCCSDLNSEPKLNSLTSDVSSCCLKKDNHSLEPPSATTDSYELLNRSKCQQNTSATLELNETDQVTNERQDNFCLEIQENLVVDCCKSDECESISCSAQLNDLSLIDEFPSSEGNEQFGDKNTVLSFWSLSIESDCITTDEIETKDEDSDRKTNCEERSKENCEVNVESLEEKLILQNEKKLNKEEGKPTGTTDVSVFGEMMKSDEPHSHKSKPEDHVIVSRIDPALIESGRNVNLVLLSTKRLAPVPPPRRRRSLYRAAEKVAKKVVDEAIEKGVKEATHAKCLRALPITEAVTRWLQSQGSVILPPDNKVEQCEDDEGIEEGECSSTNQKNVVGNPFLVSYLNGSRQRVADMDECGSMMSSAGEWDMYDHESHTRAICDPATSVDKYYRLGAEDLEEKVTSASHSMIKTAVHIRRTGPFPCGVCCIIQ